jgi:23S rRNA (cytosine1962-C5)-methyltransferase
MNRSKAVLSKKGERWCRSGHPWIFQDDVMVPVGAENGEVVSLYNLENKFLGQAFYSRYSRIALRLMTTGSEAIDKAFWHDRLQAAIARRRDKVLPTQACRLVFAEADGFPGLIADWYARHLVIQTLIPGTEKSIDFLVELFREILQPESILIRNDAESRLLEKLPKVIQQPYGKTPERIAIQEGLIQYQVNLHTGHKTGAYLDQQENHLQVGGLAHDSGRVLDCFCYSGGFALQAAQGAGEVIAVDDSTPALQLAEDNARLNGLSNISFYKRNVFDFLKELEGTGRLFDLIIMDPPPFARRKSEVAGAARGYLELNRRALRCLNSGGVLITYSCSYNITEPLFLDILAQSARRAGSQVILCEKRLQARDHPIVLHFPESFYLKGFILQKI